MPPTVVLRRPCRRGCTAFAKPWYRLRSLRVFRDDASLSADPSLWGAIESALASSAWFLLLASPEAARSEWVDKEVEWWLEHSGAERLLVVLTAGELAWEEGGEGVDLGRTTALSASAAAGLVFEPRWVDLRWARTADHLSLANARFRGAIAEIAATVLGRPKDELLGEDVRQHRRTKWVVRFTIVTLAVLVLAAVAAALVALSQRDRAVHEATVARAQALAAQAQLSLQETPSTKELRTEGTECAALLAIESLRLVPTLEADEALRNSLAKLRQPALPAWAKRVQGGPGEEPPLAHSPVTSPDGRCRALPPQNPRDPVVLEATRGGKRRVLAHEWTLQALRFSPDSRWLATVTAPVSLDAQGPSATSLVGSTVRIWDVRTGRERTRGVARQAGRHLASRVQPHREHARDLRPQPAAAALGPLAAPAPSDRLHQAAPQSLPRPNGQPTSEGNAAPRAPASQSSANSFDTYALELSRLRPSHLSRTPAAPAEPLFVIPLERAYQLQNCSTSCMMPRVSRATRVTPSYFRLGSGPASAVPFVREPLLIR
jgi:hypothetical protein